MTPRAGPSPGGSTPTKHPRRPTPVPEPTGRCSPGPCRWAEERSAGREDGGQPGGVPMAGRGPARMENPAQDLPGGQLVCVVVDAQGPGEEAGQLCQALGPHPEQCGEDL